MRRILLVVAALAIPVSAMALTSGVASAGGGPKGKTTCSSLSGTVASLVISGCVDSGMPVPGGTGGGTPAFSGTLLATGGTVTWNSGFTSTSGVPTLTSTSAKHCPGYVKNGSNNPTADKVSAVVTSSTVGFKIPGKFKGTICIAASGAISNHGPLKVN